MATCRGVLSGRCRVVHANQKEPLTGCRYWALVADNGKGQQEKHTPDVLSFLVVDKMGKRIAYGTGPVVEGDLHVEPTSN